MRNNSLRILHLTDLHIKDANSTHEKLRLAFYEEFLDGLVMELSKSFDVTSIDYLFCTGDFVDKGGVENFSHAKLVIEYLGKKLNAAGKIAVCLGNHDYDISVERDGDPIKARAAFYDFESNFLVGEQLVKKDFYQIRRCGDHYILIFDSTFGSGGTNKPSELSDAQIDSVLTDIKLVPIECTLFVLSHYPMIMNSRSQQSLEDMGWEEKHLWKRGSKIVDRVCKKRPTSLTFWFFGDGHAPDFTSLSEYHHFLMTGMIGGDYVNPMYTDHRDGISKPYHKHTEVKLIVIGNEIKINTIFYSSLGNALDPHTGEWRSVMSDIRIERNKEINVGESERATLIIGPSDIKTELISDSVQSEIIETVKLKKLYSFNRYSTSEDDVSLGWVAIPRLLESRELFNRCIDKSIYWLKEKKGISFGKNVVLIGLDIWGSVFATQISVREEVKNFCVATKNGGRHNVHFERVEALCDRIGQMEGVKYFILFTDVVATGNTVIKIKEALEKRVIEGIKWICISLISDKSQKRANNFDEFDSVGTLCSDLTLPLLKKSQLPDESILPLSRPS